MHAECKDKIEQLLQKGVTIPNPQSVLIGDEVELDRIAGDGVVIYAGCKIFGEKTLIMPGVKLGYEGPVTVEDCQIGPRVELKGGFFRKSVFLEKASMGYGAQVREGCILEEEANGAHMVGLKQTILFPFVTLGSLINFCDCLMAGGTSRKNHSEVGSSYIHFNYTPNQDKATPSLIGDVPRGVMLNQPPIFLGGQGGLVGPVRIGYGTVIAAGVVYRKDAFEKGKLLLGQGPLMGEGQPSHLMANFYPGLYWHIERQTRHNIHYIANLMALRQWYIGVRSQFFGGDPMGQMLYEGILDKLNIALDERIKRLKAFAQKMPASAEKYRKIMKDRANQKLLEQKQALFERWQEVEDIFYANQDNSGDPAIREPFLEQVSEHIKKKGPDYIAVIQGIDQTWLAKGTKWLQGIVDTINRQALEIIPPFRGVCRGKTP
ncbi:MAG: UDP-N-acetylglucosamine pyrophosphorylase [Deltaproteobacteria bacterium]|nr:UDP-N-acetylglucosamine pyrophosphorylase [Deltaproteobacteria bacterium]MBW2075687.1 UDP-N-acetylglucosamine pyrophosphorylase [Deltaproteobacteria bacterium]RLB80103.1 MAG: UDP-N-acetylglucosamine pyrophosphorylase [Deltaproteobacteria bacterium]